MAIPSKLFPHWVDFLYMTIYIRYSTHVWQSGTTKATIPPLTPKPTPILISKETVFSFWKRGWDELGVKGGTVALVALDDNNVGNSQEQTVLVQYHMENDEFCW